MAASDGRIEVKLTRAHPQQYKAYLHTCRLHFTHQPYGSMWLKPAADTSGLYSWLWSKFVSVALLSTVESSERSLFQVQLISRHSVYFHSYSFLLKLPLVNTIGFQVHPSTYSWHMNKNRAISLTYSVLSEYNGVGVGDGGPGIHCCPYQDHRRTIPSL